MPSIIDLLLGRTPQGVTGTGINPNAQGPEELLRQARPFDPSSAVEIAALQQKPQGRIGGALSKASDFIGTPGGSFLLNLLSQQGSSPVPTGGPLGAIGRAGLQTVSLH